MYQTESRYQMLAEFIAFTLISAILGLISLIIRWINFVNAEDQEIEEPSLKRSSASTNQQNSEEDDSSSTVR